MQDANNHYARYIPIYTHNVVIPLHLPQMIANRLAKCKIPKTGFLLPSSVIIGRLSRSFFENISSPLGARCLQGWIIKS